MARKTRVEKNAAKIKAAYYRSNTTLLMLTVMVFQFAVFLLLSFKEEPLDWQALIMAVLVPAVTYLAVVLFSRAWPIDRALLILTMLLLSIGLATLQDITRSPITPRNQALFIMLGFVAMAGGILFVQKVRAFEKWILPIAGIALVAILTPLVFGSWQGGAKNWIFIAGVSIQPSEFVKAAVIFLMAAGFSSRPNFKRYGLALCYVGVLCGVLLMERDLGGLMLIYLTTLLMYFAATSNILLTLGGFAAGAVASVAAYFMFPYVAKRVALYVNPWSDPLGGGWQIIQALIAIGSGGAFGLGVGLGYPRSIPVYHQDFIFAAMSEEFGLIFALCVMAVYVLIIMRGVTVAMSARSSYHALMSLGVIVLIGLQALTHIGGNIKLIPLTGVTLPFLSAGGSSLISLMGMMGFLLGVSALNAKDEAEDLKNYEWREVGGS